MSVKKKKPSGSPIICFRAQPAALKLLRSITRQQRSHYINLALERALPKLLR